MIVFIDEYGFARGPIKGELKDADERNAKMEEERREDEGRFVLYAGLKFCPDCRKVGALKGHMECEYPQN